jgi:CheY-like chemotaxis protein
MTDIKQPFFLYIEDDPFSREVIELLIKKIMKFSNLEYFIDSENYQERFLAFEKAPDVVFLDIQIQPHNGYEILNWLRNEPKFKATKVIALTASVMVQDVAKLQETGFDGLIGKPIAHRVFPRLLNQILAGEPIWYIP